MKDRLEYCLIFRFQYFQQTDEVRSELLTFFRRIAFSFIACWCSAYWYLKRWEFVLFQERACYRFWLGTKQHFHNLIEKKTRLNSLPACHWCSTHVVFKSLFQLNKFNFHTIRQSLAGETLAIRFQFLLFNCGFKK